MSLLRWALAFLRRPQLDPGAAKSTSALVKERAEKEDAGGDSEDDDEDSDNDEGIVDSDMEDQVPTTVLCLLNGAPHPASERLSKPLPAPSALLALS